MGLRIKRADTLLKFNIEKLGCKSSDDPNDNNYWLIVEVSVKNKWFNYYYSKDETLEFNDLIRIKELYEEIINGTFTETSRIGFIEPNFEFVFYPDIKHDIQRCGQRMDFIINLSNNETAFTGEKYILPLGENYTTELIDYIDNSIARMQSEINTGKEQII
jgi:hypothetical protein